MRGYHHKTKGVAILYDNIYLVNGIRTAFGKYCGTLGRVSPTDLGIFAAKGALAISEIKPDDIDQFFVANIGQSSTDTYFLPRHIGLYTGLPLTVPALMVQRICGSGFETIIAGAEQITLGKAGLALCGGTENMSLAPTSCFGNRMGHPLGKPNFVDMLWEALNDTAAVPMGCTAENVAKKHGITKLEANEYAFQSISRAINAVKNGFCQPEILPLNSSVFEVDGLKPRRVNLPQGVKDFIDDENIRFSSIEEMEKLPPVFSKYGVQNAANSSGIVDGAAMVVIAHKDEVIAKKLTSLVKILASSTSAIDPHFMGLGPVGSIKYLLEITGLSISDIDLFEINEAFAAQVLGCQIELGIDSEKFNVNGGAIALGHPLAATGIRLSLTIAREMNRRKVRYGIVSACIGGGQATSILFENENYN